jgi:hypothetical protein
MQQHPRCGDSKVSLLINRVGSHLKLLVLMITNKKSDTDVVLTHLQDDAGRLPEIGDLKLESLSMAKKCGIGLKIGSAYL